MSPLFGFGLGSCCDCSCCGGGGSCVAWEEPWNGVEEVQANGWSFTSFSNIVSGNRLQSGSALRDRDGVFRLTSTLVVSDPDADVVAGSFYLRDVGYSNLVGAAVEGGAGSYVWQVLTGDGNLVVVNPDNPGDPQDVTIEFNLGGDWRVVLGSVELTGTFISTLDIVSVTSFEGSMPIGPITTSCDPYNPDADFMITEDGDFMITEDGELMEVG